VKRYASDFIELNGDHAIKDLTREHWAKWRADCLKLYGANWTAFKRFTMMKTIVTEAIKAGLMERKFFEGQDVVMRKPERSRLRNEGWSDDELKTLFGSEVFRDPEADPADYWIPVITARLARINGAPAKGGHDLRCCRRPKKRGPDQRVPVIRKAISDNESCL
jgi:hypothetical protein